MKLGIFFAVLGLLIGAIGVMAWMADIEGGQIGQYIAVYSVGAAVFGGGLFLLGLIRMIIKR